MNDSAGNLPKIESVEQALKEIINITKNNDHHVTKDDEIEWLELKIKVIQKFANKGLKLLKNK
jgi:hypothetical protein